MAEGLARVRLARAAACLNRRRDTALPALVFLTDDDRTLDPLKSVRALPPGSLVVLRARQYARRLELAKAIAPVAKERRLVWLVADDPELASRVEADGAHFPESRMAEAHHWRALRAHWLITCAAHSLSACANIARTSADAAFLAPIFATASHAGGETLGPMRMRAIARQSPLPVYALGGIDDQTARRLRNATLAGLAAVGALAC
jgi:thiamine-phosphate pyrophosphorylase